MKTPLMLVWLAAAATIPLQASASEQTGAFRDEASIRGTLAAYAAALNGGRAADVIKLYATDGILMAPFSASRVGIAAIGETHSRGFREMKFNVQFLVREVVVMSPAYAFARTDSEGTVRHVSAGVTSPEANQELFIFRKAADGDWRIARYSFSPTNPPSAK